MVMTCIAAAVLMATLNVCLFTRAQDREAAVRGRFVVDHVASGDLNVQINSSGRTRSVSSSAP